MKSCLFRTLRHSAFFFSSDLRFDSPVSAEILCWTWVQTTAASPEEKPAIFHLYAFFFFTDFRDDSPLELKTFTLLKFAYSVQLEVVVWLISDDKMTATHFWHLDTFCIIWILRQNGAVVWCLNKCKEKVVPWYPAVSSTTEALAADAIVLSYATYIIKW